VGFNVTFNNISVISWLSALFNITNIHMTSCVSRWLNILCIMFKIIAFLIIMMLARLYVIVGILLAWGKHLHDCISSQKREACTLKVYFNPATFYWRLCTKQGKWAVMYFCVKGINFDTFYNSGITFWSCYLFSSFYYTSEKI
jgi:hypothetical protein